MYIFFYKLIISNVSRISNLCYGAQVTYIEHRLVLTHTHIPSSLPSTPSPLSGPPSFQTLEGSVFSTIKRSYKRIYLRNILRFKITQAKCSAIQKNISIQATLHIYRLFYFPQLERSVYQTWCSSNQLFYLIKASSNDIWEWINFSLLNITLLANAKKWI